MKLMFCFSMLFYTGYADKASQAAAQDNSNSGFPVIWAAIIAVLAIGALLTLFLFIIRRVRKHKIGAIIGLRGEYKSAKFGIKDGEEVVIGTDASISNVVLSAANGDLSRKHCGICYDRKKNLYYITDYSANGTFIKSGKRIRAGRQNPMRSGSVFYLGDKSNMFRLQ